MNVQDYILPIIYKPAWYIAKVMGKTRKSVFYCADPLDYFMFQPIAEHLREPIVYIAKNRKTRKFFRSMNIAHERYPSYPELVIMARQTPYKYPVDKIKKVGFDHGLYQFKRWTSSKYYNQFDLYFVSSEHQVEIARERGIRTTVAIGYPKLDRVFNGFYTEEKLDQLKARLGLDPGRKTIIFTSTWNVAGLSALDRWIDRVHALTDRYNILLTVHSWTEKGSVEKLKTIPGAVYLEEIDVTEYLLISDILVGDYNSLIGEFCALDRPIITFKTPDSDRSIPEVKELISRISYQIETFDEIVEAIEHCLNFPGELKEERAAANRVMHYKLDGMAGKRAADLIEKIHSAFRG